MPITDWPIQERPREKLLSLGPQALSEAELLAIFLRTGIKGKTAVDLARDLLNQFKGLRHLLGAKKQEFCIHPGLGIAKYVQLQAMLEMSKRYLQENLQNNHYSANADEIKHYLRAQLGHRTREVFACLFLDVQYRLLDYQEIFLGTIDCAHIHPREVVKYALDRNAASVILAHNHPSGLCEPSLEDKKITHLLTQALQLIDVQVLDHIIIAQTKIFSFAETGILSS